MKGIFCCDGWVERGEDFAVERCYVIVDLEAEQTLERETALRARAPRHSTHRIGLRLREGKGQTW